MYNIVMSNMISYIPKGTCSRKIDITINQNIIESVKFYGGCPGNLIAINNLTRGMEINEVVERIEGIKCGSKNTSCPDQLAKALRLYLSEKENDLSLDLTPCLSS